MRVFSLVSCLLAAGINGAALPSRTTNSTVSAQGNFTAAADGYWLNDIQHQGRAAFNPDPNGYKVFRNVKDYGARGDGVTDDSEAINRAIREQNRCGPWVCDSSTDSPAIVYFPAGVYIIGKKLDFYYMTMLIGNPNDRPVLKASPNLEAIALIDANPYSDQGQPGWISTNVFLRQIRNFIIDLTPIPATKGAQGIHWPASQATSIQYVKILMNRAANSVHAGIFIENGSGGFLADIETEGGKYGLNVGNQQFTMRNIRISGASIGISQIWNWGWLYQGLTISDCGTAFSMLNGDATKQEVGSVVIIDSTITNCQTFVDTIWSRTSKPIGAGQLIVENIQLNNVPVAVKANGATVLGGGTTRIAAWGQGNKYTPNGPEKFQGAITPAKRPQGLLDGDRFYTKSKPQYNNLQVGSFLSARSAGARGDGNSDDTTAIQNAINQAIRENKVLFFDHGVYKVTNTIYVPPGARMVGEAYSVIMASGNTWSNMDNPVPVIQIGRPGDRGSVEWSDMIVATQGATPGAKLIEYNLATDRGSGIWDVHTRIGGAKGTGLQIAQCPVGSVKNECMAAHTNVHITKSASGAFFENNWFWTADHDLDDADSTRVAIFTARGLLVEGSNTFLYANGVEHHSLYQYQFSEARDIIAGFIQTETPYYMPTPDARSQPYHTGGNDPNYHDAAVCPSGQTCNALGLRVVNSQNVLIYGAGLYSFFRSYDTTCSKDTAPNGFRNCQSRIFSVEGSTTNLLAYSLNQVGVEHMVTIDQQDRANWSDNLSVYSNTIGLFTYKV
ncbi:pectate lyase superfamily protein-domain-containing protein [Massariosphaeria phaeospora]|uniref:Pectate lyase superfamily protein-domain-containing protein n=1 Tax=Massariosphaeria phaeospora TaxID=100035 RepID=A0A7C8I6P0_9PLEO|nr:pectate lyase superfamily protein-domain-containing protein [Massariosphaeria phaeospora]